MEQETPSHTQQFVEHDTGKTYRGKFLKCKPFPRDTKVDEQAESLPRFSKETQCLIDVGSP